MPSFMYSLRPKTIISSPTPRRSREQGQHQHELRRIISTLVNNNSRLSFQLRFIKYRSGIWAYSNLVMCTPAATYVVTLWYRRWRRVPTGSHQNVCPFMRNSCPVLYMKPSRLMQTSVPCSPWLHRSIIWPWPFIVMQAQWTHNAKQSPANPRHTSCIFSLLQMESSLVGLLSHIINPEVICPVGLGSKISRSSHEWMNGWLAHRASVECCSCFV